MKLKLADPEHVTPHRCPKCGHDNDAATGIVKKNARNKIQPKPGDLALCFYCAHIMAYADDLSFRELTKDEERRAAHDIKVQMARMALEMTIKERTKH
jgi:hypothetical protein